MVRQNILLYLLILLFFSFAHYVIDAYAAYTEERRFALPPVEAFIAKWSPSGGSELGSSQSFLNELCDLIEVPRPASPRTHVPDNTYTFEKSVAFINPKTGKKSFGRIDLYKQGCFIWESKQGSDKKAEGEHGPRRRGTAVRDTQAWDKAMLDAKSQGERYARSLAPDEGKPPFLIVSDIGHIIEIYADFNGVGNYTPFPSAKEHRFTVEDLRKQQVLSMLKRIWTKPLTLDTSRASAKVTRELAIQLADLATDLEESGHNQDAVSLFLMRCIFTMFAEDVGLVEYNAFTDILTNNLNNPKAFIKDAGDFWQVLRITGDAYPLEVQVLRFQGYLFDNVEALPLTKKQVALLHRAAHAHWAEVDTAIFGYFLERALDPTERHALGAHYTPTAYVERLVIPSIIEPLRQQWKQVQELALEHVDAGDHESAIKEIQNYHRELSDVTVLDPSCGSGVFLAVSLSLLKELEAEVVQALRDMGLSETHIVNSGYAVNPRQLKGIEVVPRAVDISELVLWLTYLQKHYAIHGKVNPKETLFGKIRSVELRDAVLLQHADGKTEQAAPWPQADYIVGNPPFVGGSKIRTTFGSEYAKALRTAYPEITANSDYVMYWWYRAAKLVHEGKVKRFGFITTSSINQLQNRGVMEQFLEGDKPLSIVFAVPSHPWTLSKGSASVRIAMTVVKIGKHQGILATVKDEMPLKNGDIQIKLTEEYGDIHANLTTGIDVSKAKIIENNVDLAFSGVSVNGLSFVLTQEEANLLGLGTVSGLKAYIRPYRNGRDIVRTSRNAMVIDMYGLSIEEVQSKFPNVYQWLLKKVKPERDSKREESSRKYWWLFSRTAPQMRKALKDFSRYIVTAVTSKHRIFTFLDGKTIPDSTLVIIASQDAYILGVLSSKIHTTWTKATGAKMGKAARYTQATAFDTFPFLETTEDQKQKIRDIAEKLDAQRKEMQKNYPKLTLTALYNMLEAARNRTALTRKEQKLFETLKQKEITTLLKLHDELDTAVAEIYGLDVDATESMILERLLKLNELQAKEVNASSD